MTRLEVFLYAFLFSTIIAVIAVTAKQHDWFSVVIAGILFVLFSALALRHHAEES